MPDTYAECEQEKIRLMSDGRSLSAMVIVDPHQDPMVRVKDSRLPQQNELQSVLQVTPGAWVDLSVAQSQSIFA